jgi:excisionase family DNA binding protein
MLDETLLSPAQVAERLGVSRLTAVRWLHSGKLKAQKLGRKTVRMKASDLDAFINQQRPALTLVDTPESTPTPEPLLDADTIALAMKLRQPGERLSDVVHRSLVALQTQDTSGVIPRAGLSAEQRKAALVPRLRAMHAQGLSLQGMAQQLNAEHEPTLSGRGTWKKGTVSNLLQE